jgi:hypothetical protein
MIEDRQRPTIEDIVFELNRLTGCGLMTCKMSLLTLIDALKRKPVKMDSGYDLECTWKEKSMR